MYCDEKEQLRELEERYVVIKEEYDLIMDGRRKAEATAQEKLFEEKCAILIQSVWRGYRVRRGKLKRSKSKKGKGKAKGKKK